MNKTSEIRDLLRRRYAPSEWAFFEEVGNATGALGRRYADAVAMNLWPSRGLSVVGFEIKVSKQDWKKELDNPAKSVEVQQFCDYWWIVAPPNIVDVVDVPVSWGLMVAGNKRLTIVKDAPKLAAKGITREFMASAMRRGFESISKGEQEDEHFQRGYDRGKADAAHDQPSELKRIKYEVDRMNMACQKFEERTGLSVDTASWYLTPEIINVAREISAGTFHLTDVMEKARRPLETALRALQTISIASELSKNQRKTLEHGDGIIE